MNELVPVLYDFYRSSAAYRVRTVLAWKNIDYKQRLIDLHKHENKAEAYRKIVPTGKIPAFITKDGKILSQSMAIVEYLEEVYPEKPLLPKGPYEKALVREIAQIVACDVHPLQNDIVLHMVASEDDKEKQAKFAKDIITKTFRGLEERVKETCGKYSVGDSVTLADVFVVPMVVNAYIFGVDMTAFPTLARLHKLLLEIPEFKNAHPYNREDCPKELRLKQ
ncbi:maleylacetoacetate isomerase [Backusella circina FSU 941]|nr:maleylacetoacetate isomerase [Backusella circina FSU 941]